jgi:hypothetical protein
MLEIINRACILQDGKRLMEGVPRGVAPHGDVRRVLKGTLIRGKRFLLWQRVLSLRQACDRIRRREADDLIQTSWLASW